MSMILGPDGRPLSSAGSPAQAAAEVGIGAGLERLFGGARKAGDVGLRRIKDVVTKHPGKLAGAGGLLTALSAASEFADGDDPIGRNASEAAGNVVGGLGLGTLGALAGIPFGPAAPLVSLGASAVLGSIGSGMGSDIGGGIYDAVTGQSESDRELEKLDKQEDLKRANKVEDYEAYLPYQQAALDIKRAHIKDLKDHELRTQNDYNFANTLNTSLLNGQQNAAAQQAALTAYLFS